MAINRSYFWYNCSMKNKAVFSWQKVIAFFSVWFLLFCNMAFAINLQMVSVSTSGVLVDGNSGVSQSANSTSFYGRYVAFQSAPTPLSSDTDIFVHDRQSGNTELISIGWTGGIANEESRDASISADGRYVAFSSGATNLVIDDVNGWMDIFVRDRQLGITELVSVNNLGEQADAASQTPFISGNGRYVAFVSAATNLVPDDTNGVSDIFVYDRDLDQIERVSVNDLGVEGNLASDDVSISYDGRFVAFNSDATNLVAGATGRTYVYDRLNGTIENIPFSSGQAYISGNGRYVAFRASHFDMGIGNSALDIYVYDRETQNTGIASLNDDVAAYSQDPSISYNGRFVMFWSTSTTLVPDYAGTGQDIYLHDMETGTTRLVSANLDGTFGNDISRYGTVSYSGFNIAFNSGANNLVSGDTNGVSDVFLYTLNELPTNINLSPSSINEGEDIGTVVGALTTVDPDISDNHTYSFTCSSPGAGDGSFSILGDELLSAEIFDYNAQDEYEICIRTEDEFGATFDKNFTISILEDVPPPPPPPSGGGSSGGGSYNPPEPPTPVYGCIFSWAENYNPLAEENDGSCIFPVIQIPGCTDSSAINFNLSANTNDGSCQFVDFPEFEPETPQVDPESEQEDDNETQIIPNEWDPFPEVENPIIDLPETEDGTLSPNDFLSFYLAPAKNSIETISFAGLVLPMVVFVITQPAVAASIPIRIWNIIPTLLGLKRRKRPWGTVYDSVTKQPLDPVHVTLFDESGKEIATTITDLDGRFGFLVPAGIYSIRAEKDGYQFPSRKMEGKQRDSLYGDLYQGETIEIRGEEDIIVKNIPMDNISFNWNEFEKSQNKNLMKFYSRRDLFFARVAGLLFFTGIISSVILLFVLPSPVNYIVFGIYVLVIILRVFGVDTKKPGYVFDQNGFPLSFGIIKVFSAALNREVGHSVIGKTGKYYLLVPNGEYYLKISQKIGEDDYREVMTTDIVKVKDGYIGRKLKV
jgi:hypothetical protein